MDRNHPGEVDPLGDALVRFRKRSLPHWEVTGASYFVTIRLAGTLPNSLANTWRLERHQLQKDQAGLTPEERQKLARMLHLKFDALLDGGTTGPAYLGNYQVASMVQNAIKHFDGSRYHLWACTLMPNHAHFVLQPLPKAGQTAAWGLDELMHSIKSFTSHRANKLLGRQGEFWQREYYDHLIRDEAELAWYVEYTLNNPVAARLCSAGEEWLWNYVIGLPEDAVEEEV